MTLECNGRSKEIWTLRSIDDIPITNYTWCTDMYSFFEHNLHANNHTHFNKTKTASSYGAAHQGHPQKSFLFTPPLRPPARKSVVGDGPISIHITLDSSNTEVFPRCIWHVTIADSWVNCFSLPKMAIFCRFRAFRRRFLHGFQSRCDIRKAPTPTPKSAVSHMVDSSSALDGGVRTKGS